MSMHKRFLLFFILFIFTFAGCIKTVNTYDAYHNSESEEYAVYSAFINSLYVDEYKGQFKSIVIEDRTRVFAMNSNDLAKDLEYINKRAPSLEKDTISDFQVKNDKQYQLKNLFNLKVKCILISKEEQDKIFKKPRGWNEFYKIYPSSQGIMTLSRVGFNRKMNQALVYVGNMSYSKAGGGGYFLLQKKDGVWTIQKEIGIWVS